MVMKFRLYREYGALNSHPVFDAFSHGMSKLGLEQSPDGIPVIWSVLWHGRMFGNQQIYSLAQQNNLPIIIIEVGNFIRGTTWRISIDNVNNLGFFGNKNNLDFDRPSKLGIQLKPTKPALEILIAAQHERSLQWQGQPPMRQWAMNTVEEIRKFTDRPIIVRPHPRSPFNIVYPLVKLSVPRKVPNTYDGFDIDYNLHCVVNHNSGPGVQAAIQGCPVIVDSSSLASPISNSMANIESIRMPDRTQWLVELSHTEWTIDEIKQGIPLTRLMSKLEERVY